MSKKFIYYNDEWIKVFQAKFDNRVYVQVKKPEKVLILFTKQDQLKSKCKQILKRLKTKRHKKK